MRLSVSLFILSAFLPVLVCPAEQQTAATNETTEAATPPASLFMIDGVEPGHWTMDLDAAKAYAATNGLPIFMYFTGSDWCIYCKTAQKEIFTKPEWQEHAAERLVLVAIDFPKDVALVPKKYRERNVKLQSEYKANGFPTFLLLGPDGNALGEPFGLRGDITFNAFMRTVNGATRNLKSEQQRFTAGLGAEEKTRYLTLISELNAAEAALDAWFASKPERNEENTLKFEAFEKHIVSIAGQLEAMEREKAIADFTTEQSRKSTVSLIENASRVATLAAELEEAQQQLDVWLLSRPTKSAANQEKMATLLARIKDLQAQITGE